MRTPLVAATLLLAAVAADTGAAAAAASADARGAGMRPGEAFTYNFSVGAIDAGRARMSVGLPVRTRGRRLISVQGDAQNAPWLSLFVRLDNEYRAVIDADALVPRSARTVERGTLRERTIEVTLGTPARARPSSGAAEVTPFVLDLDRGGQKRRDHRSVTGRPLDPVSALFTLRAAPLRDGDALRFLAFDGPALYQASAHVAGRESLVRLGRTVQVVRVEIEAVRVDDRGRPVNQPPRHVTLWLSDDARRVPYRLSGDTDFGRCELELTSYREPGSTS